MKEARATVGPDLHERVLLVSPAGIGGVQSMCLTLGEGFRDAGHRVHVLFERSGPPREPNLVVPEGVAASEIAYSEYDSDYHKIRRMARLLLEGNYDLVYLNTSSVAYRAVALLGARRPVAIGGWFGSTPHDYNTNTSFAGYIDHIFADSNMGAEELRRRLAGHDIQVSAIPHGIKLPATQIRRDFTGVLRIIFVGRHVSFKRIPDILQVASRLREFGVPFEMILAGDGPLRGDLERQVREMGLGNAVEFPGFITQAQLEELMQTGHVSLLLSETEGFGIVALEGMKCGCVPIVTNTCGCMEVIRDGINGFVVKLGDIAAVVDRVRRLEHDRSLLRRMSEAAAPTAREDYSFDREIARHLDVLRVAQEHHRSRAAHTVPWKFQPPSLISHPWVPNWLAKNLRRLKYRSAGRCRS